MNEKYFATVDVQRFNIVRVEKCALKNLMVPDFKEYKDNVNVQGARDDLK